jgi:hypothetical protein
LICASFSFEKNGAIAMNFRIFGLLAIAAFLTAVAPGQSRAVNLTTLVNFNGTDGASPTTAGLIADANGNLFGTTVAGGNSTNCGGPGCGTVFEVIKTSGGYANTPTTLISFNETDGASPTAGLTADANGNLFGTTNGGGANNCGTVFEVIKTSGSYASTPTTLISFNGTDGYNPEAGLIADAHGNLFGTTNGGGEGGNSTNCGGGSCGTVFEVIKTSGGYASTPTTLVNFDFTDGALPNADLIADANGNLFSTTAAGGNSTNCGPDNCGTVFEITGSGFAVFAGTPGKPNCHGQSVSALVQQYGSLAAAATARGYSSVQMLQNDIVIFCAG